MAADISVCPGVDAASKNEYQNIPGGKGGRCVRVTTLPPSCAECQEIWSLNRPEPSGPHRPVIGIALPFTSSNIGNLSESSVMSVNKTPKFIAQSSTFSALAKVNPSVTHANLHLRSNASGFK